MPDPRHIPAWRAPEQPRRPSPGVPPRHRLPGVDPFADPSTDRSTDPFADPFTEPVDPDDPVVRPFLVTKGRTRPRNPALRIETLVQATPAARDAPLRFEARSIVEACQAPRSVAEVAAHLRVPLGVVRVLIDDLVVAGHLYCHQSRDLPIDLLERIKDRVRAL